MFVGVLDTETLQLDYASAGHDSAFVRRASEVQQLAVTGPVLGVMEEPFDTKTVYLEDGDTIVLATDGLTEARNRAGEQLHEAGAMQLIFASNPQPQLLADEFVAQVKALGGNLLRDDLAVLAIRVHEPEGADAYVVASPSRCFCVLLARGVAVADCQMRCGRSRGALRYGRRSHRPHLGFAVRLRDYAAGLVRRSAGALAARAAGQTRNPRGRGVAACPRFVHSKYITQTDDAVGVQIVSGPLRGQEGWVLGSAFGVIYRPFAQPSHRPGYAPPSRANTRKLPSGRRTRSIAMP